MQPCWCHCLGAKYWLAFLSVMKFWNTASFLFEMTVIMKSWIQCWKQRMNYLDCCQAHWQLFLMFMPLTNIIKLSSKLSVVCLHICAPGKKKKRFLENCLVESLFNLPIIVAQKPYHLPLKKMSLPLPSPLQCLCVGGWWWMLCGCDCLQPGHHNPLHHWRRAHHPRPSPLPHLHSGQGDTPSCSCNDVCIM